MPRSRKPKIISLGRTYRKPTVAAFVMLIGRVGKLVSEKGLDGSQAYFVPYGFSHIAELNPNFPLTQNEWDGIFSEASQWVATKYRFALAHPQRTMLASFQSDKPHVDVNNTTKFVLPYGELLSEYFNDPRPLRASEYRDLPSAVTNRLDAPWSPVTFETASSKPEYVQISDKHAAERLGKGRLPRVMSFPFSLSSYGKKAVINFFKEQEARASGFEVQLRSTTMRVPIKGEVAWSYKHINSKTSSKVLQRTLLNITQQVVDSAFEQFGKHFVEQRIEFNGIPLTTEVKQLLVSKLRPRAFCEGLGAVSKVFQALRDDVNNLDLVASVLLTADDEKEREAGKAILDLYNSMEEDSDEEDNQA